MSFTVGNTQLKLLSALYNEGNPVWLTNEELLVKSKLRVTKVANGHYVKPTNAIGRAMSQLLACDPPLVGRYSQAHMTRSKRRAWFLTEAGVVKVRSTLTTDVTCATM